jgi:hypothetical protein
MTQSNGGGKHSVRRTNGSTTKHTGKSAKESSASTPRAAKTKRSEQLTLKDRLSRLTLETAKKLLGTDAQKLIIAGSQRDLSPTENVFLGDDCSQGPSIF